MTSDASLKHRFRDTHRDTDIGALQCRSVVHAVAGHRDNRAAAL
jgi:hypothetical protein